MNVSGTEQRDSGNPAAPLLLGVMGDPVIQSMSPAMHQAALQAAGIQGSYVPLHVKPDQLEAAVQGIRALGFRGVNVTVPHKIKIMDYLDEIDPDAAAIGAVNTIVHTGGRLVGYNTDGTGYLRSLKEETGAVLAGASIVVLGAGGAARGLIHAILQEQPGRLTIANRTASTARGLAEEWRALGNLSSCGYEDIGRVLQTADIVINTTTVGMFPRSEELPVDPAWLPSGAVVSDLIYNPAETLLLREAGRKGCTIHNGVGMFVYQGAYAFELWTGKAAPVAEMRSVVEKKLYTI